MICPNCEEQSERLIEPALLRLPIDMEEYGEGDSLKFKEDGGQFTTTFYVTVRRGEKLTYVFDACVDKDLCVSCFAHGVWPSLFPYIANKPEQVRLNGWQHPEWIEVGGQ